MSTEAPKTPHEKAAARFRQIADDIERNASATLGGVFLLIAPDGSATDALLIGQNPDEAMFWSLVSAKVQLALAEAESKQKQGVFRR